MNQPTVSDLRRRLGLVAVGPQRTATSWLDRALRFHKSFRLPADVKETFYFDRYYGRGLNWYFSHFGGLSDGALLAEVGSTYFESPESKERLRIANPELVILITVRNPIARSFSSFRHEYAKGRASGDFFQAIASLPRIVESGRYGVLAPEWEEAFGSEQVLYVVQEDIEADPQGQFDTICAFLGLDSISLPEEMKNRYGQGTVPRFRWLAAIASRTAAALRGAGLHRVVEGGKRLGLKRVYGGGDRQALCMTCPIFDYLLAEHEPDINFLEEQLRRDFSHWREPATYGLEFK